MATRLKRRQIQRSDHLRDVTIRDFSGGWNVIDNDLNLTTKFAKIIRNIVRSADGSNTVRPGTELFADVSEHITTIVNMEYFRNHLIVVGTNGKLVKVDANAKVDLIWDDDWARSLPGSPSGWDITSFASFTVFNGSLVVANGINKPLSIDSNLITTYLQDLGTGSNANTPIGRYVKAQGRYLIIAGDPNAIDTIYISGTDNTTFVGDPSTDAVNISLGSRVTVGDNAITGLGSFRDRLVVCFDEMIIPITLGVFTAGGDHNPTISDEIENQGVISHRSIQTIGEDMLFSDLLGVSSVSRALFTGTVKPETYSDLINPELQTSLDLLVNPDGGLESAADTIFSVYDSQANNYMLFIPNNKDNPTETRCFVFKKIKKTKIEAWYEYRGWNFICGCRTAKRRIFFGDRAKPSLIWQMGEEHDVKNTTKHTITKDYVGYEETWSDKTVFTDGSGFTPVTNKAYSGVPIDWVWELPWSDSDTRFNVKNSRFINFDTEGDERFLCEMFRDNIYEDRSYVGEPFSPDDTLFSDGFGWKKEKLIPALSMEFVAGTSPGYGLDEYGKYYGGGRPTRLEQLYAWTSKYKIFKLRLSGSASKTLKFVSITLAYTIGSIRP